MIVKMLNQKKNVKVKVFTIQVILGMVNHVIGLVNLKINFFKLCNNGLV